MSHPGLVPQGFLFLSLLYQNEEDLERISFVTETPIKFYPEFTPSLEYYSKEMGEGLKRVIWGIPKLISQDELVKIKLLSYEIERKLANDDRRTINIDPGFLTSDQMLLTTFKYAPFRLYHSEGVYLDLQYLFYNKKFTPTAWCYPDYQSDEKILFFESLRKKLREHMRARA